MNASLPAIAAALAAVCVAGYWAAIVVRAAFASRRLGRDPNVVPRERVGQLLRLVWLPVVILWIRGTWRGAAAVPPGGSAVLGAAGATVCVLALAGTAWCWRCMGESWRMGIDPRERTRLVTEGPYRRIRHPIYGLSILLALGSLAAIPLPAVAGPALLHAVLMVVESLREERHLARVHGEAWRQYAARTGRFLPRWRRA